MSHRVPFLFVAMSVCAAAAAQDDINAPPILYATAPVTDAAALLNERLASGAVSLEWDEQHGWLPSLLKHLHVPVESQTLVFSKTSLQTTKISPERPRALYFSDDVYLGTVQFGDLIEVSAVDPEQGAMFYSIAQQKIDSPRLVRDDSKCLSCHHTSRTRDVPGYLVRSVFTQASGHPRFDLGSITSDPTTSFAERFGGWYVTGTHGQMRHRGNTQVADEGPISPDVDAAANVTQLDDRVDTSRYLSPHSDLVALMVLEHQSQFHNAVTRASYETRRAAHYDATWNRILDRPASHESDVARHKIEAAGDELLKVLLFSGEYQLTSPVAGTSDFVAVFESLGPRDADGRSLRQFDLQQRLFKYQCSYLIYSDSFASLPTAMREYIDGRMAAILAGNDSSGDFDHLSATDRTAIREILSKTLPDLKLTGRD